MDFFKMLDEKIENVCTQFYSCHNDSIGTISEFLVTNSSWFKISCLQEINIKDEEWCLLGCYAVWIL
jgi:hypothetical protein